MVRLNVEFTGRVQGVGFRYTTVEIAQRFAVAGYIQNLPGGDVYLVAEGHPDEVEDFLEAVRQRMSRHIQDVSIDRAAANGEFGPPGGSDVFTIRY